VSADTQKLVDDIPGDITAPVITRPCLNERIRLVVLFGVGIHSVKKHVGVYDGHDLRTFHDIVERVPVGDIDTRLSHAIRGKRGKIRRRNRFESAHKRLSDHSRQRGASFGSPLLDRAHQVVRED